MGELGPVFPGWVPWEVLRHLGKEKRIWTTGGSWLLYLRQGPTEAIISVHLLTSMATG